MKERRLGVIGGGFMARAIITGALSKNVLSPEEILVCDPSEESRAFFSEKGIAADPDNLQALSCEYLLFAVKPQAFPAVARELSGRDIPTAISIMAGRTKEGIRALTGARKVARVMPNLPCSIGIGMSAVDAEGLDSAERNFVLGLFLSVGEVIEVGEELLDAVTAVSGSGPAYIYLFLRALIHAGEEQGLRREQAEQLAFQTMAGGLSMARTSGRSLDDLIAAVSSKGGTTVAALRSFEKDGFEAAVARAVDAAANRARELSE